MSTTNSQDSLAERVTERDLSIIAKSIGRNWEMLAPFLLPNSKPTVDRIMADYPTTILRIYQLLLAWSNEASPDDVLGLLFHNMLQCGSSVTIDVKTIAKSLAIDERDIRDCKAGYKHPVQETNTNESIKTGLKVTETDDEAKVDVQSLCLRDKQNKKAYRSPKETCIYDGRLIKLEDTDIKDLDRICTVEIGKGGFGIVYKSDGVSEGFGMQIALKKIPFDRQDTSKMRSIRREMNASRILHPFILPLLAVVERPFGRKEFWIVSPFFEKGNLHQAIENKENKSTALKEMDRIKILLQLATAIQYIHTKVPNVRNVILHKDISSKNVVLDAANNARLIDFGLSREKDDKTFLEAEGGKYYDHPNCGQGEVATECRDYYCFGVIVREMLTGLGPEGFNGKWLKNMTRGEVLDKLENNIWSTQGNDRLLNDVAYQCLHSNGWIVDEFKTNVVEKLDRIWECFCKSKILDVDDDKCHICMINPKAKETSLTHKHTANCQQNIEVCIACEKNSFLNPITCYCGEELSPFGCRMGALLVAGNDENKTMAKALTRDVNELKNLLTSKAPCIVGISENNVRMVTPCHDNSNSQEQELLLPQIRENVTYFQGQTEIDTLLIYFSGHCALNESSSFMLGSVSEIVTLPDFQNMLDDLDNIDKLIIILDRCYPPKICFKKARKVIQINACEEKEKADMEEEGSHFTKTLIEGLKGKAEKPECSKKCDLCKVYFEKSYNFITVSSIFEYLENHIKGPKPRKILDVSSFSSNIAYFTDEQVQIVFTEKESQTQQTVQLEYIQDMEQLRSKLSEVFGNEKIKYSVRVQRNTYRTDKEFEDCDTIEKVMQAWVHRQPLIVKFESIKQTDPSN